MDNIKQVQKLVSVKNKSQQIKQNIKYQRSFKLFESKQFNRNQYHYQQTNIVYNTDKVKEKIIKINKSEQVQDKKYKMQQLAEEALALKIYTEMIHKVNEILTQFELEKQQMDSKREEMENRIEQLQDLLKQKNQIIAKLKSNLNKYQSVQSVQSVIIHKKSSTESNLVEMQKGFQSEPLLFSDNHQSSSLSAKQTRQSNEIKQQCQQRFKTVISDYFQDLILKINFKQEISQSPSTSTSPILSNPQDPLQHQHQLSILQDQCINRQQYEQRTRSHTSSQHKSIIPQLQLASSQPKLINSPQQKQSHFLKSSNNQAFIKQLFPSSYLEKQNHCYAIKTDRQMKLNRNHYHQPLQQNQTHLNSNQKHLLSHQKYLNFHQQYLNSNKKHVKNNQNQQNQFDISNKKSSEKQQTQKGWKNNNFLLQNIKPRKIPFGIIKSTKLKI